MGTQTKKTNKYMSLAAVTLAFSFTFLSRYIWSPLMADVSGEFGINATQAGLYMSAFFCRISGNTDSGRNYGGQISAQVYSDCLYRFRRRYDSPYVSHKQL